MSWAGAIMLFAGAVMIWAGACSDTNFPTLQMLKNSKKAKCDGRTDRHSELYVLYNLYCRVACDKKILPWEQF